MELDVIGMDIKCLVEMEIDFIALSGLHKAGQILLCIFIF